MGLFRRKKVADKVKEDRELVETNGKAIEALVVLAGDNAELVGELRDLQEKLKYLIPAEDSKVVDYDKKIRNLIDDLRILFVKSDGESTKKAKNILMDIKLAIADRNTKL